MSLLPDQTRQVHHCLWENSRDDLEHGSRRHVVCCMIVCCVCFLIALLVVVSPIVIIYVLSRCLGLCLRYAVPSD